MLKVRGVEDDETDRMICTCKNSNQIDWKSTICEQSCTDFCIEDDDQMRVCNDRCIQKLCSIKNMKCDISYHEGEVGCS